MLIKIAGSTQATAAAIWKRKTTKNMSYLRKIIKETVGAPISCHNSLKWRIKTINRISCNTRDQGKLLQILALIKRLRDKKSKVLRGLKHNRIWPLQIARGTSLWHLYKSDKKQVTSLSIHRLRLDVSQWFKIIIG